MELIGIEESLKESPIGTGDLTSCLTIVANKIKYQGCLSFLNNKSEHSTCI